MMMFLVMVGSVLDLGQRRQSNGGDDEGKVLRWLQKVRGEHLYEVRARLRLRDPYRLDVVVRIRQREWVWKLLIAHPFPSALLMAHQHVQVVLQPTGRGVRVGQAQAELGSPRREIERPAPSLTGPREVLRDDLPVVDELQLEPGL